MKILRNHIVAVLLLLSLALNGYYYFSLKNEMRVTSVHDGDTFTLANGDRVKLLGANAPELGKCGAQQAKEAISKMAMGKIVKISEEKRDAYGRRMGLVWAGTALVNEEMLKSGWARPDYSANSQNEKLKTAFREASENKTGIHSELCKKVSPKPPNNKCVIKGNIDKATWAHLYHLPSCRHYNQIVLDEDLGEGFFCSEKEAQDAGFTLAPDCLR